MQRPQSAPKKKTRRVIDTKKVTVKRVVPKNTIDTSCYRLSKTAPINGNKVVLAEQAEPFADKYYREHEDERGDLRPPEEKLKDIEARLDENLEEIDRFNLLMKQKCYIYVVYGETSEEALRVHASLGDFYNFSNKPKSALRHFEKAHALEPGKELDNDTKTKISVGMSEAHLALSGENKREINHAGNTLKPALELEIENKMLKFRRDLTHARILSAKEKYEEAYDAYMIAEQSHKECEHEEDESTAKIYTEFGEACRNAEKYHESLPFYQKAYDIYTKLEMTKEAEAIAPFLELHEEEEVKEEEEAKEEEEKKESEQNNDSQAETKSLSLTDGLKEQITEKIEDEKLEADGEQDLNKEEEEKNEEEEEEEEKKEPEQDQKQPTLNLGESVQKVAEEIASAEDNNEEQNVEKNSTADSFESSSNNN